MTQQQAYDLLRMGENVFLTGAAGSGKTYLLNKFIRYLHNKHIRVAMTATTGIAATHLGGVTLDSWSGLGIKEALTEHDMQLLLAKKHLRDRYKSTQVLIIDEISMLHFRKLDMVDKVSKLFRANSSPFGGMQIVFCGDFFQLPPVVKDSKNGELYYAFKSWIWHNMNLKICYLEEQHRQKDPDFTYLLNALRRSDLNDRVHQLLDTAMKHTIDFIDNPTQLYTHNADVDSINKHELQKLNGEAHRYTMSSQGQLAEFLKNNCLAPEILELKRNSLVMFVRNNFKEGYVNGTLGTVIGFDGKDNPVVETIDKKRITVTSLTWTLEEDDKILASITQVPLRLAWAITVHKSQGMTLDAAEVDLRKSFVYGMGYVAFSRVRSLSGLKLIGYNKKALEVDPAIIEVDQYLQHLSREQAKEIDRLSWFQKFIKIWWRGFKASHYITK